MNTPVVVCGEWTVHELVVDAEKLDTLVREVSKHRTLFSDLNPDKEAAFVDALKDPLSYWLEVVNTKDELVGLIYLNGLSQVTDADLHIIFFDRSLSDKSELCKSVVEHLFKRFVELHRMTARVPAMYFVTRRLALRIGFQIEGKTREALLIGNKWVDEMQFGILASEVLNGTD